MLVYFQCSAIVEKALAENSRSISSQTRGGDDWLFSAKAFATIRMGADGFKVVKMVC